MTAEEKVPELSDIDIGQRTASLLHRWLPTVTELSVERVERVFGGNARRAWACEVTWRDEAGMAQTEQMILLMRIAGSQVQTDPDWEFGLLDALSGQAVRAPRAWAYDPGGSVFGTPSVLLGRLGGTADAVAFLNNENREQARTLTLDFASAMAELHTANWRGAGRSTLLTRGSDDDGSLAPRAQVDHWESAFKSSRREPHPVLGYLFDWLGDNLPEPTRLSIVHGDLRPGNFLYEADSVVALLDWEMGHIGDPVEDIAWAYRGLWSPERFVALDEFIGQYERSGGPLVASDSLLYYRVFSEVKFATISLQASRAFADGSSTSLRLIDRARTVIPSLQNCLGWITDKSQRTVLC